jgi:DNA-binding GntR family transcriptional regulator
MRKKELYTNFSDLSINAQIVFATIELILDRYLVKEMHITKEDLALETAMSIPSIKVSLRELKNEGYVISKNSNSPIIRIGELYEYKGK